VRRFTLLDGAFTAEIQRRVRDGSEFGFGTGDSHVMCVTGNSGRDYASGQDGKSPFQRSM